MAKNMLERFLNTDSRVKQWPAKYSNQLLVLQYLVTKFSIENTYTEREVNDILKTWHTYGDWATLRRALVDGGLLTRTRDGSEYRRV